VFSLAVILLVSDTSGSVIGGFSLAVGTITLVTVFVGRKGQVVGLLLIHE